ncbi:hypothetical protein D5S17_04515 [Pseudonocardiaceae bacterium YIM PH 21723]|nr:hypothetical protein D5S17_04515 [Pseudonocardiaceae bacterium YIM PH 21723]
MPDFDGFAAPIEALIIASSSISDLMAELRAHNVSDIDCDASAFGHAGLASVTADFCDRWQTGVKNLTKDGAALAAGLGKTAQNYLETDKAAAEAMAKLEADTG